MKRLTYGKQLFGDSEKQHLYNELKKYEDLEERHRTSGWIPCEERLPEEPFGCMVTVIDSAFNGSSFEEFENVLPYHVGYDGEQWNDSDGEQIPFEVTAWQAVPEPYKTEK